MVNFLVKLISIFIAFAACVILASIFESYGYKDAMASMAQMGVIMLMADRAFGDK